MSLKKAEEQLMLENPEQYCQYACTKIGYYLKKVHQIELIRMRAEFHADDFGRIWLFWCKDVWVRTFKKMQTDTGKLITNFCERTIREEKDEEDAARLESERQKLKKVVNEQKQLEAY